MKVHEGVAVIWGMSIFDLQDFITAETEGTKLPPRCNRFTVWYGVSRVLDKMNRLSFAGIQYNRPSWKVELHQNKVVHCATQTETKKGG